MGGTDDLLVFRKEYFMAWRNRLIALGLAAALLPTPALAADHLDGSTMGVMGDAATDISDLYSWMSTDGSKIYLIMSVWPKADKTMHKFTDKAWYVFHTASRATFLTMQSTSTDVVCGFDAAQTVSCWVGTNNVNFVHGDANNANGITSADGKIKVFAGPRKDHFFFNLDGFNAVRTAVKQRQLTLPITLDSNGCAAASGSNANGLTTTDTMNVRNQLQRAPNGAAGSATDFFANDNTLAIVLEIDKTLLTAGGPIFSVWAATHKKM